MGSELLLLLLLLLLSSFLWSRLGVLLLSLFVRSTYVLRSFERAALLLLLRSRVLLIPHPVHLLQHLLRYGLHHLV